MTDDELVAAYVAGVPVAQIGGSQRRLYAALRERGIPRRGRGAGVLPDSEAEARAIAVRAMRHLGASHREIAERLGMSVAGVIDACDRASSPPRPVAAAERHAQMLALDAAGLGVVAIARSLGMTREGVRRALLRASERGERPPAVPRDHDARRARIRDLLAAGRSVPSLAAELGIARPTAYQIVRGMRERGEL